ncbi:MAG: DNA-formamidopyrimidine glycosylase family protein [Candidatus Latescibacterota bacterium]
MPELPEIANLARQMNAELPGKRIIEVSVRQAKCLNVPVPEFSALMKGKTIGPVTSKGKWLFVKLMPEAWFLLNLGMGGDVLLHQPGEPLPEKHQVKLTFSDGASLSIRFWWFGYTHAVSSGDLQAHPMTAQLGVSPTDEAEFTYAAFCALLAGRRGNIKSLLTDQKCIAGIGNVYIQDMLFSARLHPARKIPDISGTERKALFCAIRDSLKQATDLGGLAYEKDLYNLPGRLDAFRVGYRAGKPCPECGTPIEKIKTGTTASYICPSCQK